MGRGVRVTALPLAVLVMLSRKRKGPPGEVDRQVLRRAPRADPARDQRAAAPRAGQLPRKGSGKAEALKPPAPAILPRRVRVVDADNNNVEQKSSLECRVGSGSREADGAGAEDVVSRPLQQPLTPGRPAQAALLPRDCQDGEAEGPRGPGRVRSEKLEFPAAPGRRTRFVALEWETA